MGSRELLREGVRHHSPDGRANQRADSACTDKRRRRVNSSVSGQLGGLYQERGWPFAIYGVFLNTIALGEQNAVSTSFSPWTSDTQSYSSGTRTSSGIAQWDCDNRG